MHTQIIFKKEIENKTNVISVQFGYDFKKRSNYMEVYGNNSPFKFKKVYGVNASEIESWLKSNGWTQSN